MTALVLVRHSAPQIDQETRSTAWGLSAAGWRLAELLSESLAQFHPSAVVTSPERKARETAGVLAAAANLSVHVDEDLREHERPGGFPPGPAFTAGVEALLQSTDDLVFGAETADEVFLRFSDAIDRATCAAPERDHLIVSHGTAMAIYVGRILGVDPVALWRDMKTPTALVIRNGGMETIFPEGGPGRSSAKPVLLCARGEFASPAG